MAGVFLEMASEIANKKQNLRGCLRFISHPSLGSKVSCVPVTQRYFVICPVELYPPPAWHINRIGEKMRVLTGFAVLAMVFCVTESLEAQGRRGVSPAMLVGLEQIQEELDLNEEQIEKVKELADGMRGGRGGGGGRPGADGRPGGRGEGGRPGGRGGDGADGGRGEGRGGGRGGRGAGQGEAMMEKIGEILNEDQMSRLKQITLQIQGSDALRNPEVAESLDIDEEQMEDIESTMTEAREEMRDEMRSLMEDGDRESAMQRFGELRKEANDKVMALLSDDQRKKMEEMMGEPFELDMSAMRGGRRGGGRGGAGGRGGGGRGGAGGAGGRPGGRGGDN